jgi:hypothetical protein
MFLLHIFDNTGTMMPSNTFRRGVLVAAMTTLFGGAVQAAPTLEFNKLDTYEAGDEARSEIVAYDPGLDYSYVSNGDQRRVDVLAFDAAGDLVLVRSLDVSSFGAPNSVAVRNNVVAVAVEDGTDRQAPGKVFLFDATTGAELAQVTVGATTGSALPDMLTFASDNRILVANEGEPDHYTNFDNGTLSVASNDPTGSISVIDISDINAPIVTDIGFDEFNLGGSRHAELDLENMRVFGPGATIAQDLEPEYIAVSADGNEAYVTLQENNAVAVIDLTTNTIKRIDELGYKDHSLPGNELDPSNRDGGINIANWPVLGMYQPDSIDAYTQGGQTYYVTANEGDAREYFIPKSVIGNEADCATVGGLDWDSGDGCLSYTNEARVKDLVLDLDNDGVADAFSPLQDDDSLGRLKTTVEKGDTDGDGLNEEIYSFGARSFTIWDAATGALIWDSGSIIEQLTAALAPEIFNQDDGDVDDRSDDKGPEPEALSIVQTQDWVYALVGLERTGGFMIFDITDPTSPEFQQWIIEGGDISPEGIYFALTSMNSRGGSGIVAVANEVSGTTTLYQVSAVPLPATLALLGLGLVTMRRLRRH